MNVSQYRKQVGRQKGECTWCGKQVPKGCSRWCSNACWDNYSVKHDWPTIRKAVLKRDHGICAICRFDAEKVRRIVFHVRHSRSDGFAAYIHLKQFYAKLGYHALLPMHLWAIDHIKPRVLGGGHEIENLRTLCVACHKTETARLAAERAEARRST